MKNIIQFSKFFLPAAIISTVIVIVGVGGFFINKGFNLGVDFQAGLMQEVQFAPTAFKMTYDGRGTATVSASRTSLIVVLSGVGIDEIQHDFPFTSYVTLGDLVRGLSAIEGLYVQNSAPNNALSTWLVQSAQNSSQLGSVPYVLHYLAPDASQIHIEEVRTGLERASLGNVSVQVLGDPPERRFLIRMDDNALSSITGVPAERIVSALETIGYGEVAIIRSDRVDQRFSKNLTDQIWWLIALTLTLVFAYISVRFKPQYAIGAIVGIINDAIVIIAFVVWTRMEFTTSTIAAILTIFGYSTNNTIVVFDRVRENLKIFPEDSFVDVLNRSLTGTLNRTIITTVTTMLAVLSLFIFTTPIGFLWTASNSSSMKDFALALLVGMTSGVYTTLFIASGIVYLWEKNKAKKEKQKLAATPVGVKA